MARILIMSEYGAGLWFSLRLLEEGNSVDSYVYQNYARPCLRGIVPDILSEKPDFSRYDLILFDQTGRPRDSEAALKATATIGDNNLATELEDNREFGIEVMEQVGIEVPPYEVFDTPDEAKKFIRKTKKRYVFKPFEPPTGEQNKDVTYVSSDSDDMLRYIDRLYTMAKGTPFMLQEFVSGTECSIEGWFNGDDFYFVNATLEEKKFMDGGKGPNTGCSGNLLFSFGGREPRLFRDGLQKMRDFLAGAHFRGMIDLNTIVTEDKAYGLEWTPRFGYDASPTLYNAISSPLADLFGDIATGGIPNVETSHQFSAGVRVSIPPYPSEIKGKHPSEVPIDGVNEDECIKDIYLYDCMVGDRGELCTCGTFGIVCVPLASGDSIGEAFGRVYEKIKRIKIPNMQYRTDMAEATMKRHHTLDIQGWI